MSIPFTSFPIGSCFHVLIGLNLGGLVTPTRDVSHFVSRYQLHAGNALIIVASEEDKKKLKTDCKVQVIQSKQDLETLFTQIQEHVNEQYQSLFLLYSGHGYGGNTKESIRMLNGDIVTDVEFQRLVFNGLKPTIKCFCLIDSCHSGTMLNSEFVNGKFQPNVKDYKVDCVVLTACNTNELDADTIGFTEGFGGGLSSAFLDAVPRFPFTIAESYSTIKSTLLKQRQHSSINWSLK